MKNLLQVFLGIIVALASISLLLGGFSLSLAEGNTTTATATVTLTATLTLTLLPPPGSQPLFRPPPSPRWIQSLPHQPGLPP
jgi:hypothetical protein